MARLIRELVIQIANRCSGLARAALLLRELPERSTATGALGSLFWQADLEPVHQLHVISILGLHVDLVEDLLLLRQCLTHRLLQQVFLLVREQVLW